MKKISIIIILVGIMGSAGLFAQQTPLYTQYMFNPFVLNPAIAGTFNYYQIRSNHRFQWVGITDPPVTNALSIYGPHSSKDKDMGFGGYIYNDVTGPTSRTGVSGAYAYNIAITPDIRLSMGAAVGVMQYKVDGSKITTEVPDPSLESGIYSTYVPDATVGLYLYSSNFQVGFSAAQLINNKLKLTNDLGLSKLKSHFYLTGGYKYYINREFAIEPTVIFKAVSPAPIQVDFSTKVIYQNMVWGGISYRSQDAIAFLAGYTYENKIYIGYSYDMGISDFRQYNSGSHEIMIGYKFKALK
jgi:type IX secretion system PorP/SprF family membrane protein